MMQKYLPESDRMFKLLEQSLKRREHKEKLLKINLHLLLPSKRQKESQPKKELTESQLKSKQPEKLLKLVKPEESNKQELRPPKDKKLLELPPKLRLQKQQELLKGGKL